MNWNSPPERVIQVSFGSIRMGGHYENTRSHENVHPGGRLPGGGIPQPHGLVIAAGDDDLSTTLV